MEGLLSLGLDVYLSVDRRLGFDATLTTHRTQEAGRADVEKTHNNKIIDRAKLRLELELLRYIILCSPGCI